MGTFIVPTAKLVSSAVAYRSKSSPTAKLVSSAVAHRSKSSPTVGWLEHCISSISVQSPRRLVQSEDAMFVGMWLAKRKQDK